MPDSREKQIDDVRRLLAQRLPAGIVARADMRLLIEGQIASLAAVVKIVQDASINGFTRDAALALSAACLQHVAAMDAIPLLGAKITAELFGTLGGISH